MLLPLLLQDFYFQIRLFIFLKVLFTWPQLSSPLPSPFLQHWACWVCPRTATFDFALVIDHAASLLQGGRSRVLCHLDVRAGGDSSHCPRLLLILFWCLPHLSSFSKRSFVKSLQCTTVLRDGNRKVNKKRRLFFTWSVQAEYVDNSEKSLSFSF